MSASHQNYTLDRTKAYTKSKISKQIRYLYAILILGFKKFSEKFLCYVFPQFVDPDTCYLPRYIAGVRHFGSLSLFRQPPSPDLHKAQYKALIHKAQQKAQLQQCQLGCVVSNKIEYIYHFIFEKVFCLCFGL